jgi:hypothetical protein
MPFDDTAVVPTPAQLDVYRQIDVNLPALILELRDRSLKREFHYALVALCAGSVSFIGVVGGFIYLVMQQHPAAAASLLGTGVFGMIGAFLRTRLDR